MTRRAEKPSRFAELAPPSVAAHVDAMSPLVLRRADGGELALSGDRCAVMAIVNLTPDSFSDGGRYAEPRLAIARAEELVAAGAELVDLGAASPRPGATPLDPAEEWRRLAPVLAPLVRAGLPAVISVDTRHAEVAERASAAGARLLNLTFPQDLPQEVGDAGRLTAILRSFDGIVIMHSRGDPATMRARTDYGADLDDLCQTVVDELRRTVASLLAPELTVVPVPSSTTTSRASAVAHDDPPLRSRLIFDPGLGFAKTAEQSVALLARLRWLRRSLGGRLLIGASRKSMLGAITGLPTSQRLIPSVMAAAFAAYQGADIVRVHDVAETLPALRLAESLRRAAEAHA
jgi:dihydropteroate synthase